MISYRNVTVLMITKEEERAVRKVISDIKKDVPGAKILIVDSSKDNTPKIARQSGAKVIRQYPPRGYGPAMLKGLLSSDTDYVVTMDCDNTYPTRFIPKLIKVISQDYDVVGTSRLSGGKPKHMPYLNYIANKVFNFVATVVFQRNIQDVHSGMRVYRKKLIREIRWDGEKSAFPVELLLKPIELGYKWIEIPIEYNKRLGFTSLDRLGSTYWTFIRILKCRFST